MRRKQSYYGMQKKMILKKKLLVLLSNYTDFVTSKELAEKLNIKSPTQVQALCRELEGDISRFYPDSTVALIINQKGILLKKERGNIYRLVNEYHHGELSFHIFLDLHFERVVSVKDFCHRNFISEATLRRKVRQVNKNLEPFNLRVICSDELKIIGEEDKIWRFYVLAIYFIYQKLSNLKMPNLRKETLIKDTKKILDYLSQTRTDFQLDSMALIYGVVEFNIYRNRHLEVGWRPFSNIPVDFLPTKPDFLINWTKEDWEFLLISFYLYNLYIPKNLIDYIPSCCLGIKSNWEKLFMKYFPNHLCLNKKKAQQETQRLFMFAEWFPQDNYLFNSFPVISEDKLKTRYPLHLARYELFWKEFSSKFPNYDSNNFRLNSLLLTLYLTPLDARKEKIILYLESFHSFAFIDDLKTTIYEHFWKKYKIVFTTDKYQADLLISTAKQFETQEDNKIIFVHPLLLKSDLALIEKEIKKHIKQKYIKKTQE